MELLSPPQADRVLKKIIEFQKNWHSKKFASELPIDKITLDEDTAREAIKYILSLNPRPAEEYVSDSKRRQHLPLSDKIRKRRFATGAACCKHKL